MVGCKGRSMECPRVTFCGGLGTAGILGVETEAFPHGGIWGSSGHRVP